MHSQPFIWPGCYEDQVFERSFSSLKSLAVIIAISLTAFLPWGGDDTVSPTASQLDMSQFPRYFHTVDVTDISSCSRTVFTWRKFFSVLGIRGFPSSFQESICFKPKKKKGPRPKLHPLISGNEHKRWKFIQIPMWRNKPAWAPGTKSTKKAWLSAARSVYFFPQRSVWSYVKSYHPFPLQHSQSAQVSEICILQLFATGISQSVAHRT